MGGLGKGGGSQQAWQGFSGQGGGGGGGGRQVNVMRPGGGKPMPSTTDSSVSWPRRVTGEQQPAQARPGGGSPQAITPEAIAMMKSIAKYAALGAIAGPGGTAAGGAYGAWKERSNQKKLMEGAEHISAGQYKNTSPAGNPRAGMPGRPAVSYRAFSGFGPQDLLTGQPSVKSKGFYQGPVRNSGGGSSSLLGGDEFEEEGR